MNKARWTRRNLVWRGLTFLMGLGMVTAMAAEEEAKEAGKKPATHELKAGALDGKLELDAVFEAVEQHPLKFDLEEWGDLTVAEVLEHGARVKEGEVLVRLETDKLEEQIKELADAREASDLTFASAVAELDNLRKTTPIKLESLRRGKSRADDDYAYFEEVDRSQRIKSIEFGVKGAEERLANAREELDQLEKMYQADDLTEETEEIVLKRQKFAVESAEFFLENSRLSAKRNLETMLPRDYENLKTSRLEQELALELAEQSMPNTLLQKEKALAKMERDRKKAEEKLANLQKDHEGMALRSPIDGLLYYGACEDGKWTTGPVVAKKLTVGGKLTPREVILTVVDPKKLQLRTVVAEKDLAGLERGQAGTAEAVALPDQECKVNLKTIAMVPQPGGGFPAVLTVKLPKASRIVPGMNAKVTFETRTPSQGVVAPKKAVFAEGEEKVVYVAQGDEAPQRRVVKTGRSDDKMIDLIEGVKEGEKILLDKPSSDH